MRRLIIPFVIAWVLLCVFFAVGCTRTVYVPHGTAVRLREPVENVKVWVLDKENNPVPGEMDLPEGWYCLPKGN